VVAPALDWRILSGFGGIRRVETNINKVTTWLMLVVAMCAPAVAQAAKDTGNKNTEQEITRIEEEMRNATLKGDSSVAERYLASNYVRVYPDGSVADRQQAIADLKGRLKYTSLDTSERQVFVNGDTVVTTSKATIKGTRDGKTIDGDYRGVRTWVRQGGKWKAVAFSTTKIGGM
jgi:ketosteroid isomerase-like protein